MSVAPDPEIAKPEPAGFPCHVCGNEAVQAVAGLRGLGLVTSDCRRWESPWQGGARLGACGHCGTVQKDAGDAWRAEAQRIYDSYRLYPQGSGVEQAVFDPVTGAADRRSRKLLDAAAGSVSIPARGRMLDIGCGNGAMLSAFAERYPGWSLLGADSRDDERAAIEAIAGVERFHHGDGRETAGGFDLISMVHVLEHIAGPDGFLEALATKLNPGGTLLIQVPHFLRNAFDLLIVDHCSHFTPLAMTGLLTRAGYDVLAVGEDWVPRELTVIATPGAAAAKDAGPAEATARDVEAAASWLRALSRLTAELAAPPGTVGLFGTSIAATWLAGEIDDNVAFFVDEDAARIGNTHLGRPVLAPDDAPGDVPVVVALAPSVSASVGARLRSLGLNVVLPPDFPGPDKLEANDG